MANLNHIDDEEYLKLLRSLGTDETDTPSNHSNNDDNTNYDKATGASAGAGADGGFPDKDVNAVNNSDNPEEDDDDEEYQGDDPSSDEEEEEGSIAERNRQQPNPSTTQQTSDTTAMPTTDLTTTDKSSMVTTKPKTGTSTSTPEATSLTQSEELDEHALEDWDLLLDQDALEEELGSLFQEDLEATVNTLLNGRLDFGCGTNAGAKGAGAGAADVPAVVATSDGIIPAGNCDNPGGGAGDAVANTDSCETAPKNDGLDSSGGGVADTSTSPPSSPTKHCTDATDPTTEITTTATTPSQSHRGVSKSLSSTPSHAHTSTTTIVYQATNLTTAGSSPYPKSPASLATLMTPTTVSTITPTTNTVMPGSVVQQPPPTEQQILQLRKLMSQHYQITLQQAVLAVRAAHGNKCQKDHHYFVTSNQKQQQQMQMQSKHQSPPRQQPVISGSSSISSTMKIKQPSHPPLHHQQQRELLLQRQKEDYYFGCAETSDDLVEIIDGAVTMLQDLDKNRKDGIRYGIQMHRTNINAAAAAAAAMRKCDGESLDDNEGAGGEVIVADVLCGDGEGGRRRRRGRSGGCSGVGLYPTNAPSAARSILGAGGEDGTVNTMSASMIVTNIESKSMDVDVDVDVDVDEDTTNKNDGNTRGMLTRSAFSRTLQQQQNDWEDGGCSGDCDMDQDSATMPNQSDRSTLTSNGCGGVTSKPGGASGCSNLSYSNGVPHTNTIFDVKALTRLNETFAAIDNSLSAKTRAGMSLEINILMESGHGRACELLLQHARADYDKSMIPGYRDLSELVSYRSEVCGSCCLPGKMAFEKEIQLRKCRGQFTSAEDNLLLRGVVSVITF